MKVLMVCLGNICRSPLAQGLLEAKIKDRNLSWEVDSAGTGSWHIGEGPDKRSIAVAKNHGISIEHQRARTFKPDDFKRFDLILAMDGSNYNDIIRLTKKEEDIEKVHLILNFLYPNENRAVPDPYFDGSFEQVFSILDLACDKLILSCAKKHSSTL